MDFNTGGSRKELAGDASADAERVETQIVALWQKSVGSQWENSPINVELMGLPYILGDLEMLSLGILTSLGTFRKNRKFGI
jgi:hypothetical protein